MLNTVRGTWDFYAEEIHCKIAIYDMQLKNQTCSSFLLVNKKDCISWQR